MDLAAMKRCRRFYVVGLYVLTALLGVSMALGPLTSYQTGRILRFVLGLTLAQVVVADARAIGKPVPHFASWQLFLFAPFAAAGCVVALRKGPGVLYVAGHGLLLGTVYVVAALLVSWFVA